MFYCHDLCTWHTAKCSITGKHWLVSALFQSKVCCDHTNNAARRDTETMESTMVKHDTYIKFSKMYYFLVPPGASYFM